MGELSGRTEAKRGLSWVLNTLKSFSFKCTFSSLFFFAAVWKYLKGGCDLWSLSSPGHHTDASELHTWLFSLTKGTQSDLLSLHPVCFLNTLDADLILPQTHLLKGLHSLWALAVHLKYFLPFFSTPYPESISPTLVAYLQVNEYPGN